MRDTGKGFDGSYRILQDRLCKQGRPKRPYWCECCVSLQLPASCRDTADRKGCYTNCMCNFAKSINATTTYSPPPQGLYDSR